MQEEGEELEERKEERGGNRRREEGGRTEYTHEKAWTAGLEPAQAEPN